MRLTLLLLTVATAAAATGAAAQSAPAADSVEVPQVDDQPTVATRAVSPPAANPSAAGQLTAASQSRQVPAQLASGRQSGEAPQPLSRPEQGRTAAVAPVTGKDRCDPATVSKAEKATCANVIETRAGDFAAATPEPLSPEQKLLIDLQYGVGASDIVGATQELARTGQAKSQVDSGVASVALQPTPAPAPKKPDEAPLTQQQIDAIVGSGGSPPQ